MDFTGIVSQPWFWQAAILTGAVLAAFFLGILLTSKNRTSWISSLVLFPAHLLQDVLDIVHTKKFKYYGLILALLAIETFFAFRAATVYYDVLHSKMPAVEMGIVSVIVFAAVGLCGYMVATHDGKWNFWRVLTMIFVIVHDWAGTIWLLYAQPAQASTSASAQTGPDLTWLLAVGMCVVSILPFIMGAWAEDLRPQLEKEMETAVREFTDQATRKIKHRAVDRVLRMANHTELVRLVQALPSDEFLAFKKFVLPIIAPGQPFDLPEMSSGQSEPVEPVDMKQGGQPTLVSNGQAGQADNGQSQGGQVDLSQFVLTSGQDGQANSGQPALVSSGQASGVSNGQGHYGQSGQAGNGQVSSGQEQASISPFALSLPPLDINAPGQAIQNQSGQVNSEHLNMDRQANGGHGHTSMLNQGGQMNLSQFAPSSGQGGQMDTAQSGQANSGHQKGVSSGQANSGQSGQQQGRQASSGHQQSGQRTRPLDTGQDTAAHIRAYVLQHPKDTRALVAEHFNVSTKTVQRALKQSGQEPHTDKMPTLPITPFHGISEAWSQSETGVAESAPTELE